LLKKSFSRDREQGTGNREQGTGNTGTVFNGETLVADYLVSVL
jgi:hypothetical protein